MAAAIANANRGKHQKPFKPEDFMPKSFHPEPVEASAEEATEAIRARFQALAQAQQKGRR